MRVDVPHLFDRLQCLTMGNKTYVQYLFDIVVMMCSRKMILITIVKVKKLSSLIEISVKSLTSILQIFVKVVVTTPFILCAVGFLEFLFCSAGLQSSNSIWSELWKSIEICDALIFDRSPHNFVGNHLTILSCKEVLNSRLTLSSGFLATMTAEHQIENRTDADLYSFFILGENFYNKRSLFSIQHCPGHQLDPTRVPRKYRNMKLQNEFVSNCKMYLF